MTFKVTIGKFGGDDTAEIKVDGRAVGWLERVRGERFKSATSYARVSFVSHYTIVLTDDAAYEQLREHDVKSRLAAKLEVERAFQRAWDKLASCDRCGSSREVCSHLGCVEGREQVVPLDEIAAALATKEG